MKSWEYSKNIIAFFQSFPTLQAEKFSFFTTLTTSSFQLFNAFHSNFENPELKEDPYEITEELVSFIKSLKIKQISIDLISNLDYITSNRHQRIFEDYVFPMVKVLSTYTSIESWRELEIDVFTLQGLFDKQRRTIIPEAINTVVYI